MAIAFFVWVIQGSVRTGDLVDEFVMSRPDNLLRVGQFYTKDNSYIEMPQRLPLNNVLRSDLRQGQYGAMLVISRRDGEQVFPLRQQSHPLTNEFLVLDKMQKLTSQSF